LVNRYARKVEPHDTAMIRRKGEITCGDRERKCRAVQVNEIVRLKRLSDEARREYTNGSVRLSQCSHPILRLYAHFGIGCLASGSDSKCHLQLAIWHRGRKGMDAARSRSCSWPAIPEFLQWTRPGERLSAYARPEMPDCKSAYGSNHNQEHCSIRPCGVQHIGRHSHTFVPRIADTE
jgi:hypothetical protein